MLERKSKEIRKMGLRRRCPRCGRNREMTRHSPSGHHNPHYILLCAECHRRIHKIPFYDKKKKISMGRK